MNILEADSINLSFSGNMVLNNIFLSCKTGEVVGLLGRNGSGKSSLLKVIFGTLRADNQSVRINKSYFSHPYRQNAGIRYLPQEGFLPGYLRLRQVEALFQIPTEVVQEFNELNMLENEKIKDLSGGQKKLIEVLSILYSDADFILLDEPFSFLSPVAIEKLTIHLKNVSSSKGIVLTDHMFRTVLQTCDRLYLVGSGVLREIHEPSQLVDIGYITQLPD